MTTYARVGPQTAFVQTFAVLEVLHVLLGWVKSPLATAGMQVSSRLFLIWGVTEQFPEVRFFFVLRNMPTHIKAFFSGPVESPLHKHGPRLVIHGSHPILVLFIQFARKEPIPIAVVEVHYLLRTLSHWRIFRSIRQLCQFAKVVTFASRIVDTFRLYSRAFVCHLVAWYLHLFISCAFLH